MAAEPKSTMDFVEEEPEAVSATAPSEEAPYGYKADGTPYKRNISAGRRRGTDTYEGVHHRGDKAPTRKRQSLESQIAGFLWTVNVPLTLIPALQRDALDTTEVMALAKAVDDECQRNARFRKAVEQALAIQGGTNLIVIIGLIIGRRAIRHGLVPIPEEVGGANGADQLLGAVVGMAGAGQKIDPTAFMMQQQQTASVES